MRKSINVPPTEKQLNFIWHIERRLAILFTGKTKQDAFDFISKNIAEFYQRSPYHIRFSDDKPISSSKDIMTKYQEGYDIDPYEYDLCPFSDGWGGAPDERRGRYS